MSLIRLQRATHIADRLNELAALVKIRSRASLTDASQILETVCARLFNALFGWNLKNLNAEQYNYPAADLGDFECRTSIQITVQETSEKIKHTAAKASNHNLGEDFDRLIIFFLLAAKPNLPRDFTQPVKGPKIETWDIAELLNQLKEFPDLDVLARVAQVLDEEMGKLPHPWTPPPPDISRIVKYVPAELIGREAETKVLDDTWTDIREEKWPRNHVLSFVAFGGEGKTSLVTKWATSLAAQDWPGCDAVFAWSFYSQGTSDQVATNSDLFLKEALTFFGDEAMAGSAASAFDKGRQLARLVGERRTLLILDGVEPLQYAPTSPMAGALKDQGLATLLKGLAARSRGLCVVTTRYVLPDLKAFLGQTMREEKLARLPRAAGVHLLKTFGVRGSERRNLPLKDGNATSERINEFEKLVEDVKGHALTLNLLGSYLRDFHAGDIRQRDLVKLGEADAESEHPGHAAHVLDAYVQALESGGRTEEDNVKGRRALALLRLTGLFDRPATADCLAALWNGDAIAGFTDALAGLEEGPRNRALQRLEDARLLTVTRETGTGELLTLDAHPLLREYFARRVREGQPEAWRAAHRRLYEHLCAVAPDATKDQSFMRTLIPGFDTSPTLEDLQPLYQAVAHACYAGLHEEAWTKIFRPRILRNGRFYSYQQLGAVSSDLGALAFFFESRWSKVSSVTTESTRGRVLNAAGLRLRLLGRLSEALEAHQAAVKVADQDDPLTSLRNLSELQLALGDVRAALKSSSTCANNANERVQRLMMESLQGNVIHQSGNRDEALQCFRSADRSTVRTLGKGNGLPFLHSLSGFWYFDLLLAVAERAAWQRHLVGNALSAAAEKRRASSTKSTSGNCGTCRKVADKAARALRTFKSDFGPLDVGLYQLVQGRASLYEAMLKSSHFEQCNPTELRILDEAHFLVEAAVGSLYGAGSMDTVPGALLTRAWLRFFEGQSTCPESAHDDLNEAWEIAERGPMRLFMVDILLYRARLFFRAAEYPWKDAPDRAGHRTGHRTAKDDLADAEYWISHCGYHRRDEELADAKKAVASS